MVEDVVFTDSEDIIWDDSEDVIHHKDIDEVILTCKRFIFLKYSKMQPLEKVSARNIFTMDTKARPLNRRCL